MALYQKLRLERQGCRTIRCSIRNNKGSKKSRSWHSWHIVTDLVNHITVGFIPAEWQLSFITNCYKRKADFLERRNYVGLKWTDQILKIAEIIIESWYDNRWKLMGCSLVSCKDVELQMSLFIFRQLHYREILQRNI